MTSSPDSLLPILQQCWSAETSPEWRPNNPARGQCGVTALIVHDLHGGTILKTETGRGWHFYNRVDGTRHDLTAGQFETSIDYADIASSREEALAGTTMERYRTLKMRVRQRLAQLS
ncbi:conserved hypothetical protein [Methylobacterium sp. 4-46]|uniref:YunG family protein n=1 Tax=unclassified Methylobacterium TaxID=2615210 RepID=UPI000152CBFA|nr:MULTISPECIES: hypothetical protein [Methylobacterium]ACA20546.1 conserved hypothetical protein [Methylobacterium sp. 4-46]WFT79713.1 hypothetical protein QA634_31725 [Methylobacterium nodulans]